MTGLFVKHFHAPIHAFVFILKLKEAVLARLRSLPQLTFPPAPPNQGFPSKLLFDGTLIVSTLFAKNFHPITPYDRAYQVDRVDHR